MSKPHGIAPMYIECPTLEDTTKVDHFRYPFQKSLMILLFAKALDGIGILSAARCLQNVTG
jgi:hypothetical protein